MQLTETVLKDTPDIRSIRLTQLAEDGNEMAHGSVTVRDSRFHGKFIKAMLWGGIGTAPEYRRAGCVREMFNTYLPQGKAIGTPISLLHPFSFAYYRKFGYERVSNTTQAFFPLRILDSVPRYPDLIPYESSMESAFCAFFNEFTKNRNLAFRRWNASCFAPSDDFPRKTYVLMRDGQITGYVHYSPRKHYDHINRVISDELYVYELGYRTPDDLQKVLGFLRMYDGELEQVRLHDINPIPEVDWQLRRYMDVRYEIHPDLAARILDTEAMLRACDFPKAPGAFTVNVQDTLPDVAGCFRVAFGNGASEVERLPEGSPCDLSLPAHSFVKFLYGCDQFTPETAAYLDGTTVFNPASDLFRAFPKRINGLFEHF